ncbi:cytochrome c oxidase subunit 3 family protein [Nocardia aobensis]|uniref:Cytochrome aa3 subunit 3 n=1 Tax=Nocardia aobensis TaxID=257277 RepID=A0ABW6NYW5_9NOCA
MTDGSVTVRRSRGPGPEDMAERLPALKRHPRRVPGEPGLWILILGDLLVFAIFFGLWSWNKAHQPELFVQGRAQMNQAIGLANTLVLISSSAAVAMGLNRIRSCHPDDGRRWYRLAAGLGGAFVALKLLEYSNHVAAGADVLDDGFFMYYFVFTGIHLIHVVAGIIALLLVIRKSRRLGVSSAELPIFEGVGVYWHMVDIVWIVLYSLMYLM